MDSQFVNFDGRSVHDVLQILLAASGDPEAIARLQQAIQTVDAKFGPVNDELARLEDDKQDVGDYTEYVTGDTLKKVKIQGSQYLLQLVNKYSDNPEKNAIFNFSSQTGKIEFREQEDTSQASQVLYTFSADEDTGWQTLTGEYVDLYYRKKNGVLYLKLAQAAKQIISGAVAGAFTLPEGFRLAQPTYIFFDTANASARLRFYIAANNGSIDLNPSASIAQGTQLQGVNAIPI